MFSSDNFIIFGFNSRGIVNEKAEIEVCLGDFNTKMNVLAVGLRSQIIERTLRCIEN